jgi:hypothetical protein
MTFTVTWNEAALDELLQLWNDAKDRGSITLAAKAIDPTLRNDPVLRGETYTASTRVLILRPLLVIYRVFEADRVVKILSVCRAPPIADHG